MDKVSQPDIDAFMMGEGEGGRQRWFFVGLSLTEDGEDQCTAPFKRTKRVIKLLTVREILDGGL